MGKLRIEDLSLEQVAEQARKNNKPAEDYSQEELAYLRGVTVRFPGIVRQYEVVCGMPFVPTFSDDYLYQIVDSDSGEDVSEQPSRFLLHPKTLGLLQALLGHTRAQPKSKLELRQLVGFDDSDSSFRTRMRKIARSIEHCNATLGTTKLPGGHLAYYLDGETDKLAALLNSHPA